MRRWLQRWAGTIGAVLFLIAGTAGFYFLNDIRADNDRAAQIERRRNDIETCHKVQAAVDALEGNRDVLLSFAQDQSDPRVVAFREKTDAQIAKARQDCSKLPKPPKP